MKLHNLNAAILSVDYKDTDIILPPKVPRDYSLKLEGMEKTVYDYVLGVTRTVYDQMMMGHALFACVLALLTRLRQICIAPYLITAESKREKLKGKSLKADEAAMSHLSKLKEGPLWKWVKDKDGKAGIKSAKMETIGNVLKKIPKEEKALVFSMFTSCLDLLKYKMDKETDSTYGLEQLDGDTPALERDAIIDRFNTDINVQALFMTYKTGAEGSNMSSATHVICIEPWWNRGTHKQAEARAWRVGQKKNVTVHNIFCDGSIESRVIEICNEKDEMIKTYLGSAEPIKKGGGLDKYSLGKILGVYA
jgi:SNF2 family DNA or RNA helicase